MTQIGVPVAAAAAAAAAEQQALVAGLPNAIIINLALTGVAERLQLRRILPMAVERAIFDLINPVVERAVTISCMTTMELIKKVWQPIALTSWLTYSCPTKLVGI